MVYVETQRNKFVNFLALKGRVVVIYKEFDRDLLYLKMVIYKVVTLTESSHLQVWSLRESYLFDNYSM